MRNRRLIALLSIVMVLVLSVVVCGALFLVRSVDAYSYYEHSELDEYNRRVVAASGVKVNSSMFLVDEAAVKSSVEAAFPEIEVVNIRRSFPDRVTINYVICQKSFQYSVGGRYYQCYASGRIGGSSDSAVTGYFTLKPRGATSETTGEYFQPTTGVDRKYIDAIIKLLRAKGMDDFRINQFIRFVDLRRNDYVYIRTNAGCSIEIHDTADNFDAMLDRGFAIYAKMSPEHTDIMPTKGLIKVYPNSGTGAIVSTYLKTGVDMYEGKTYTDAGYYSDKYEK